MFNNWNKSDVLIFLSLVYSAKKNFLVDPGELCSSQGLNYHESLSLSLPLFNALPSVDNHAPTNQKNIPWTTLFLHVLFCRYKYRQHK